jgi:hypothetical protein
MDDIGLNHHRVFSALSGGIVIFYPVVEVQISKR